MSDAFMDGAHLDHDRLAMLARMSVGGDAIMLLVDPVTSRIVEASPAAESFYGWSREELLGMCTVDLNPDSMRHVRMDVPKALAAGGHEHVVSHRKRSGEERMVEVHARAIRIGEKDYFVATISDVTELRSALGALEASQQRYQRLVELSPDGMFVEVEKRFAYLNPATVRLLGARDASELIGKPILDFIHPDFREEVDSRMEALSHGLDDSAPTRRRYVRVDGEVVDVEVRAVSIQYDGQQAAQVLVRDISEKARQEAVLAASEERYRELVELSPDGLLVEVKGKIVYVNPAVVKMFGAEDASQLVGRNALDLVHPDFRADVSQRMKDNQAGMDDSQPATRKHLRLDGTALDVEVRAVKVEYEGQPAGQVLIRDISERVRTEAVMAWNAAIVESSDDAIYSEDVNGTVLNWNRAAERIYGFTAEQVVGRSVYDTLIPPELAEDNRERLRAMWLEDKPEHFETKRLHRSGRLTDVAVTLSPIHNSQGLVIGIAAIGRDISERKQLEQAKDEFLSLVSHELRTPLTTVIGYAQLLSDAGRHFPAARRAQVGEKMLERANDMLNLIEELLDATRLRSGGLQLQPIPMDPAMLSALPESFPEAERERLRIVCDGRMSPVTCDPKWVSIAVSNLLVNALKFSPPEEPVVLEIRQDGSHVAFRVHDNGPGLDADRVEALFDRFVQGDMSTTRQHEGAGLGLYIVRRVAEMHGGTATYEPGSGGGSTFTILLPTG